MSGLQSVSHTCSPKDIMGVLCLLALFFLQLLQHEMLCVKTQEYKCIITPKCIYLHLLRHIGPTPRRYERAECWGATTAHVGTTWRSQGKTRAYICIHIRIHIKIQRTTTTTLHLCDVRSHAPVLTSNRTRRYVVGKPLAITMRVAPSEALSGGSAFASRVKLPAPPVEDMPISDRTLQRRHMTTHNEVLCAIKG